jgi:RNA dependent RNA polymerase
LYFVGWDERLLPPFVHPPMDYNSPEKKIDYKTVTQEDMLSFFFDYMNFDILGNVANSHLALSDQNELLAKDKDCIRLAESILFKNFKF